MTDAQTNAKATLCLKPGEPVSHAVTIVIQLELSLYKKGESDMGGRETAEGGGLYSGSSACLSYLQSIV